MIEAKTDVNGSTEIVFDEGIIGVPRARRFELLEQPGSAVRILRCLDLQGFALPVVEPHLADPAYRPALSQRVADTLGLGRPGALPLVLAVATLEASGPVANLRAPLVINVSERRGAQVILEDRNLPLRAPVKPRT